MTLMVSEDDQALLHEGFRGLPYLAERARDANDLNAKRMYLSELWSAVRHAYQLTNDIEVRTREAALSQLESAR